MLLKIGSKGEDVKTLQKKLGISADGVFGDQTKKAVIAYQEAHGLQPDGIVGDKTWASLNAPPPVINPVSPPVPAPHVGTTGTAVDFIRIVGQVIDNLEGGYYHPAMLQDGRLNVSNSAAYSTSGETMFGLDRSAGHELFYSTPRPSNTVSQDVQMIESNAYKYKNDAAAEFWGTIDKAGAKTKWKWNYLGGDLNGSLKSLAGQIMKPNYEKLANQYLGKNRPVAESDPRLAFHFVYACWNGPGWFKKFASDMNAAIAAGKTNPDDLANVALDSRIKEGLQPGSPPNALIKQGGEKIAGLFPKLLQEF